ncbi:molybdopterin-synthase adenylyltransferase MoeB [Actinomyces sp. MRS3W]|uniref:molybdopterin-synthase adenylyltransferase MoeB n=1 Tax=Actinomyces sp. MRS3W TaxID=2800796 RepID=UPI0028FD527A|nr:molybdopterin-synthase adenylyltransferase MoeB [Actinomyces sp. MRS3W]MDU0349439.1 molybdopterin-synthase adenylyltransferase MoeB [Actinomyces sp. MRS3W]
MAAGIQNLASVIDEARLRPLTAADRLRYGRNLLVPEVGAVGQQRIRAARILVVGAGGLGSPAISYLAAAGVGTLGIIDDDVVDLSNLQRQVLHTTDAVGTAKVDSARRVVAALNPDVEVVAHRSRLGAANAEELLRGWDVVIDGTDNFPTRYLLGDACVLLGIPLVHGAVLRSHGQVAVFDATRGPCYRCVHPEPPEPGTVPSCAEAGVLGVLPGIVGAMQAAEALKLVVGGARPLIGCMLLLDVWGGRSQELPIRKNPDCPVCGERPTITALLDDGAHCGAFPQDQPDSEGNHMNTITAAQLHARIASGETPGSSYTLLDVREPHEVAAGDIAGAVHIALDQVVARRGELDAGKELIVYCAVGMRSQRAIEALAQAGYAGAMMNLEGGIQAWLETA